MEELKKAKELALKQGVADREREGPDGDTSSSSGQRSFARKDDEPDWQSNLSSWKNMRRKQSEETLMRVAEINLLDDEETDPNKRKM